MNKKVLILLIAGQLMAFMAKSQDTLLISKDDLVQHVLQNNLQSKIAEQQTAMAEGDLNQSKALFLPSVSATQTSMMTNNPLMAFGSKLNQERLTAADFDPKRLNDPDRIENYSVEVQVLQPLLNLDGVYQRQAAQIQVEAYELQAARIQEHMEMEAIKAYMQLQLTYEVVAVLERAKHTADQGLKLMNDYFDQGLAKRADVLDVAVRQIEVENQLRYAKSNIKNASDGLATLLGNDIDGTIYKPQSTISGNLQTEAFSKLLPQDRKDLVALNKAVLGHEKMLKSNKMSALPRVNAFGNYQVYDSNPLGFGADGYLVGLQISWNIFDGNKNVGKIQKAQAMVEKATIEKENYAQQAQFELNKTNRQLADAENKVELSQKAFEQKAEAYRIRKDRFMEGLEKTADLLMAETQMFQKELEHLQALFEYNLTKEYLRFLTR